MISELVSIVAPIFACAALGLAWTRLGGRYDPELVTALIIHVGMPCLIFSELVSIEVEREAMLRMALGALAAMGMFALLGWIALHALRLPSHTFLGPLVFANAGNMGLPLCLFAFGQEGLALATCFFASMAITHYTVGIWLWSGRVSLRELFQMPLSYATLLAVGVLTSGVSVPLWILRTTDLLGGLAIPLMLLTLGVSLGQMRIHHLSRTLTLSLLRLGMGFGVGVALAQLLEFEGLARSVLILECSMPVAVLNYILAERYGRRPEEVASLVVVSTALAALLLPLLLIWLL